MAQGNRNSETERFLIVLFRIIVGWTTNKFLVDFHVTYAGLCVYLTMKNAGHVFGSTPGLNACRWCGKAMRCARPSADAVSGWRVRRAFPDIAGMPAATA